MIKLTDNIYMTADQHQYIIGKPRQRMGRAGEYTELVDTQYFTTVAAALSAALSRAMRTEVQNETVTTLQGFIDRQQDIIDGFIVAIEPLHGRYTLVRGGGGPQVSHIG